MIGGFEAAATADIDSLDGGDGDDAISGAFGDDTISGGNDNDLLFGGQTGNDTLRGAPLAVSSTDNDRFVFNFGDFAAGETDLLLEFNDDDVSGESIIEISGFGFADLAAFLAEPGFGIVQNGTDTDILMGLMGGKITLFNFSATDLGADDFIFS